MTEKGCDNCYYTYFDEKAYPCSLCIRGIERTDQWQPSKKTKAEAQTEIKVEPTWEGLTYGRFEAEPQIDGAIDEARFKAHCMNCQRDVADIKCLDCDGDKYFIKDEPQTDCSWK